MKDAAARFIQEGRGLVDAPALAPLAEAAIQGFQGFLLKPEAERAPWTFDLGEGDGPDDGYVPRDGDGGYDMKWFFHFRYRLPGLLQEAGITPSPEEAAWLSACGNLLDACISTVSDFTGELGPRMEMDLQNPLHTDAARDMHVVRLLVYNETGPASRPGVIGKGHYDRDYLTIHVAESRPGLVVGQGRRQALYVPEPGRALVMPGVKFYRHTGRTIPPLWHEVLNPDGQPRHERRWSVVFFSHTEDDGSKLTDEELHAIQAMTA